MPVSELEQHDLRTTQADSRAEDYFNAFYKGSEEAADLVGGFVDRFYTIGGLVIRLRFAGPALLSKLTQAFAHLEVGPDRSPSLTVHLWDSESTGVSLPSPPWRFEDYAARGEIRGYNTDRIHSVLEPGTNTLSMLDDDVCAAVFWVSRASQVPSYESGAPLRAILHWWMAKNSLQMVHAGAVGMADGGVLLAGKGGMGKTTTTVACLDSGMLYAGDDYVLLGAEPRPFIHSIYSSAKLDDDSLRRFPHLADVIFNPKRAAGEKAVVFLKRRYGDRISPGFPLKALLIPSVTELPVTTLKRASAIAGMTALAPSTIFQLPGAGANAFQLLGQCVKQVPCYRIELGTDLPGIPEVILDLLSRS